MKEKGPNQRSRRRLSVLLPRLLKTKDAGAGSPIRRPHRSTKNDSITETIEIKLKRKRERKDKKKEEEEKRRVQSRIHLRLRRKAQHKMKKDKKKCKKRKMTWSEVLQHRVEGLTENHHLNESFTTMQESVSFKPG
jgi:hypothetical protein